MKELKIGDESNPHRIWKVTKIELSRYICNRKYGVFREASLYKRNIEQDPVHLLLPNYNAIYEKIVLE